MEKTVFGEFQKNSRELLRVASSEYNGHSFIDIRVWTNGKDGGTLPTKKGVAIHPDLLPQLIELLTKAARTNE
jgi:hypothetical protein